MNEVINKYINIMKERDKKEKKKNRTNERIDK